jgi:hypothetical protein
LKRWELQQGKREVKPDDLRLACRDIHATSQYVLLDAALILRKIVLFAGMVPGRLFLL